MIVKKILLTILGVLITCSITAFAGEVEYIEGEYSEFPRVIYDFSTATFSLEPSPQQKLYERIKTAVENRAEVIDLTGLYIGAPKSDNPDMKISYDEFYNIYESVAWNNPEMYYMRTGHAGGTAVNGLLTEIKPLYLEYGDDEKFFAEIDYVLSRLIAPDMSDIEKLAVIHDYIIDTTNYGVDNNNAAFTAYGALVDKLAVCQGYSMAYKLLCNRAGIDCGYVLADAYKHMWNVVNLGDDYYNVDVTWDDPGIAMSDGTTFYDNVLHRFFLLDDETSVAEHGFLAQYCISDRPPCTDALLHDALPYKNINDRLDWCGGKLWYKERGFYKYPDGEILHEETGRKFRLDDGGFTLVSDADYLPDKQLAYVMYNVFDGRLAIDGEKGRTAQLYFAKFDDGVLVSVEKVDVVFDESGRFTADVVDYSKIMLLDGLVPMAYAVEE